MTEVEITITSSNNSSDNVSNNTSDNVSNNTSDNVSNNTSDNVSNNSSDNVSNNTSDNVSNNSSDNVSNNSSDNVSNNTCCFQECNNCITSSCDLYSNNNFCNSCDCDCGGGFIICLWYIFFVLYIIVNMIFIVYLIIYTVKIYYIYKSFISSGFLSYLFATILSFILPILINICCIKDFVSRQIAFYPTHIISNGYIIYFMVKTNMIFFESAISYILIIGWFIFIVSTVFYCILSVGHK